MRRRRGDYPEKGPPSGEYRPGSLILEFGRRCGWPLSTNNIMVEGDIDVQYYQLANSLYVNTYHRTLLNQSLSLFAVGRRDQGGTPNVRRKFVALREILAIDPTDTDGNCFRVICLLDNDYAGKKLCYELKCAGFAVNKDVFLLHREMPRSTRDPAQLTKYITEANAEWNQLDCEIEDLLPSELLQLFLEEYPNSLCSQTKAIGIAHHYEMNFDAKSNLLRFVKEYASLEDLQDMVDVLKTMRYLLRLEPEGKALLKA